MADSWKNIKPKHPPNVLTDAPDCEYDVKNLPDGTVGTTRTRIPAYDPDYGTYGDTVYPGCKHTDDPRASKVSKVF